MMCKFFRAARECAKMSFPVSPVYRPNGQNSPGIRLLPHTFSKKQRKLVKLRRCAVLLVMVPWFVPCGRSRERVLCEEVVGCSVRLVP